MKYLDALVSIAAGESRELSQEDALALLAYVEALKECIDVRDDLLGQRFHSRMTRPRPVTETWN